MVYSFEQCDNDVKYCDKYYRNCICKNRNATAYINREREREREKGKTYIETLS